MLWVVNYVQCVAARSIDPDDLVGASEVAAILGLSKRSAVSVYRSRYPDFPAPVVDKAPCLLWLRQDVEAWSQDRAGR